MGVDNEEYIIFGLRIDEEHVKEAWKIIEEKEIEDEFCNMPYNISKEMDEDTLCVLSDGMNGQYIYIGYVLYVNSELYDDRCFYSSFVTDEYSMKIPTTEYDILNKIKKIENFVIEHFGNDFLNKAYEGSVGFWFQKHYH